MTSFRQIGTDLATLQVGWPIGMPLCRSLGAGLWEVRSKLANNRTARLIFFVAGRRIGILHGFIKKTRENATGRNRPSAKADEGDDEMTKLKKNPHWGSTLDEFLDEAGISETAKAVTRVVVWQLSKEMKRQGMSKARLASYTVHKPRSGRSDFKRQRAM